jgi:hypothetical protein
MLKQLVRDEREEGFERRRRQSNSVSGPAWLFYLQPGAGRDWIVDQTLPLVALIPGSALCRKRQAAKAPALTTSHQLASLLRADITARYLGILFYCRT